MKLLVLGGGLMGPAAAFQAMVSSTVEQVIICDESETQLRGALAKLAGKPGASKLGVVRLDLNNQAAAIKLIASFDVVVAALPQAVSALAVQAALQAGTPIVDLSLLSHAAMLKLQALAQTTGGLAILGCGLEPGLTEIVARYLAEQLDQVDELHIKCGGIPEKPDPPLGYKIVFGGRQLPLSESDARLVENGQLKAVARYSGVERTAFSGVGEFEAYHEGFMSWLLDLPTLQNLRVGTQKTLRWPGYAAKIAILKEMGLLSQKPVQVDGVEVAPKKLLDALLYPQVKLQEGEKDIVLFHVEVLGQKVGEHRRLQAEMVDRYDEKEDFTAMARTTAFTGSIVAQMVARGDIQGSGLYHPEQVIAGLLFEQLFEQLASAGITFKITAE